MTIRILSHKPAPAALKAAHLVSFMFEVPHIGADPLKFTRSYQANSGEWREVDAFAVYPTAGAVVKVHDAKLMARHDGSGHFISVNGLNVPREICDEVLAILRKGGEVACLQPVEGDVPKFPAQEPGFKGKAGAPLSELPR